MNNFKVLVKQIINDCREQQKYVTPALTSFIVETLYNPLTSKFYIEQGINESNVEEIKKLSVQKLSSLTPQLSTLLDLQIKHEAKLIDQDFYWTENLRTQSEKTTSIIDSILSLTHSTSNNYDTLSKLYQRIFNFLLFKNKSLLLSSNNLVNENDNQESLISSMEKEVAAALESVIPRAALSPFIMLNNTEKVTQLAELSNLVLGIRLFNKEIGKGGNTIQDINELIEKIDNDFLEKIRNNVLEAVGITEKYAFYFDYKLSRYEEFSEEDDVLNSELMFLRQYTTLLMNLMEKVESSVGVCESAESRYLKEIADLKTLLGSKSSAPKEQVYPKFAVLANSYMQIADESRHTDDKLELFEMLKGIFDEMTFTLGKSHQAKGELYASEIRKKQARDAEEQSAEHEIVSKNNVLYIEPKHTPEFLQISLDILGFCIVTLVDNNGLLMPGQHTFGVFKYKNDSFVFRNVEEAMKFIERPNFYIDELYRMCREFPWLIMLLRVEDYFKDLGLTLIHIDPEQKGQATKIMLDTGHQTSDHYEKFIDHNYCWNEWELRRKAIQMANIRNMTTKSTQTADSISHVENYSQVWLMKDSCSQTGINSGNNPIRPRNYVTDLRDKTNQ